MIERVLGHLKALVPASEEKADHDYFNCFVKSKADIEKAIPLKTASVLVVGCGYFYPDVFLYSTCAGHVVGIDVKECFWRDGFAKTVLTSLKSRKGIVFAINNTFKSRFLIQRKYYGRLEQYLGRSVDHGKLNLFSYDGGGIPFDDNTFDVVVSNAVLEHVEDLSVTVREMARVTKESGINYHLYHNYYSFSGNHKPYTLNRKHPWGHLRGLIKTNPQHLNRAKIYDLKEMFLACFKDVEVFSIDKNHCKRGIDGSFQFEEEALFQRYRRELEAKFPVEMLLSRGFLVVGKNRIDQTLT